MAIAIIEINDETIDEEHVKKCLCSKEDSIYHESDVSVKWIDDQEDEIKIKAFIR